jgi:hypothetical protein
MLHIRAVRSPVLVLASFALSNHTLGTPLTFSFPRASRQDPLPARLTLLLKNVAHLVGHIIDCIFQLLNFAFCVD